MVVKLLVRPDGLEHPLDAYFTGHLLHRHQPQAVERQKSHAQQRVTTGVLFLVHGDADHIRHDLRPHIGERTPSGEAPGWELVLREGLADSLSHLQL